MRASEIALPGPGGGDAPAVEDDEADGRDRELAGSRRERHRPPPAAAAARRAPATIAANESGSSEALDERAVDVGQRQQLGGVGGRHGAPVEDAHDLRRRLRGDRHERAHEARRLLGLLRRRDLAGADRPDRLVCDRDLAEAPLGHALEALVRGSAGSADQQQRFTPQFVDHGHADHGEDQIREANCNSLLISGNLTESGGRKDVVQVIENRVNAG